MRSEWACCSTSRREALSTPCRTQALQSLGDGKRRAVRLGPREYLVWGGSGLEAGVEVDERGRTRPGPAGDECRPRQPVECVRLLTGEIHRHLPGRVRDEVDRLGHRRLDLLVRHPVLHRRELLAAQVQPRGRLSLAREGFRIRNRPPIERHAGRRLEFGHEAIMRRAPSPRAPGTAAGHR